MSVSFRGTENYVASPELMGAVDVEDYLYLRILGEYLFESFARMRI